MNLDKLIVKFARAADVIACSDFDNSISEAVLDHKMHNKEIVVAELDGQIVGYLRLEYLWSKIPYIALIRVDQSHRSKGCSRAILNFVEQQLIKQGYKLLLSSSQGAAPLLQQWHCAMGFEECGVINGINPNGVGEIFFRKLLS